MKKILATILATALGLCAWGGTEVSTAAELQTALASGGDITLTANVEWSSNKNVDKDVSIDLNGKTLTFTVADIHIKGGSSLTMRNGNIVFAASSSGDTLLGIGAYNPYDGGNTLTIEDAKITVDGVGTAYAAFYAYDTAGQPANVANFVRTEITYKNDSSSSGGLFKGSNGAGTFNLTDSTVLAEGNSTSSLIVNATINISGSSFTVKDNPNANGFNNCALNVSDSTLTITNNGGRGITPRSGADCTFDGNSTVTISGNGDGDLVLNKYGSGPVVIGDSVSFQAENVKVGASYTIQDVSGESIELTDGGLHLVAASVPVTNSVQSVNLFGAIKVTGVASNMFVAVPFEGFDGNAMPASNVVHAANLADDTKMYVWKGTEYSVYESASGKWTTPNKITVTEDGATVGTADLATAVAAGTGVILQRPGNSGNVYVYGQLPATTAGTVSFGAGQTLVSALSTNAMADVNLNAFTWTGVKATTKKRLKGQAGADYIQFRDKNNNLVKYYYLEGEGWGVVPTQVTQFSDLVSGGKALVPAGTAFWYYSSAGGAQLDWGE